MGKLLLNSIKFGSFRSKIDFEFILFVADEAECELNCKPVGMSYFATLGNRVVDGTGCTFPIGYANRKHSGRAMCVDGMCKVRNYDQRPFIKG